MMYAVMQVLRSLKLSDYREVSREVLFLTRFSMQNVLQNIEIEIKRRERADSEMERLDLPKTLDSEA